MAGHSLGDENPYAPPVVAELVEQPRPRWVSIWWYYLAAIVFTGILTACHPIGIYPGVVLSAVALFTIELRRWLASR